MNLPTGVLFNEELRLMVFRPRGILNAKAVAELVRFLEEEEDRAHEPFNRFTDTSQLDAIDLDKRFVYRIALHRRRFYVGREPVRSAFYITSAAAGRYVKIHARRDGEFSFEGENVQRPRSCRRVAGRPAQRVGGVTHHANADTW